MIGPGELLNKRYEVIRDLGKGGFGTVWLAHDKLLDRPVALKALIEKAEALEQLGKRRARAELEARTLAKLAHPAIVTIHDLVYHGRDKDPWIVMGYFPGRSLDKIFIPGSPMPEEEVIGFAQPVLGGLLAAHAKAIIHRDIKPGNILRADDGSVLLVDFGIAKAMDSSTFTSDGIRFGSLPYMSPEQLEGEPAAPAADIWSLGAVMHQALQGSESSPFLRRSRREATINAIFNYHPPLPGRGGSLGQLVLAMLHKDPGGRPAGPDIVKALRQAQVAALGGNGPAPVSGLSGVRDRASDGGGHQGSGHQAMMDSPQAHLEGLSLAEAAAEVSEVSNSQAVEMLMHSSEAYAAKVLDLCDNHAVGELIGGIAGRDPFRASLILEIFDPARAGRVLDNMDRHSAAAILAQPSFNSGAVLRGAHQLTGAKSLSAMPVRDAARLIARIDEDLAAWLLARVTPQKVADILRHVSVRLRTHLMKKFSPGFQSLVQRHLDEAQG